MKSQQPRRAAASRRPKSSRLLTVALAVAACYICTCLRGSEDEAFSLKRQRKAAGPVPKVLYRYGDYELKYVPRGTGSGFLANIPRVTVEKILPPLLSFRSLVGAMEGSWDREIQALPDPTQNTAGIRVDFPRVQGKLMVAATDPSGNLDADPATKVLQANYEQPVSGLGDLGLQVRSNGDWGGTLTKEVKDFGLVRTAISSDSDWSATVERTYQPVQGVTPTLNYGATQDGVRVKAKFDKASKDKRIRGTYVVQNPPGLYGFEDLIHDARVEATDFFDGRHSLEVAGKIDRDLPKQPWRGSLKYKVKTRPGDLEGSLDMDRVRLKASNERGQVMAAVGTRANLMDPNSGIAGRPAELELQVGNHPKVIASAKLREGPPKVRLDVLV
mmetsp:Transcript_61048/g.128994  ORF Transcript_61048/g.128994 Transcript_61048/m.128994 type:complete len:387 (+) Transcript_61048:107-1267(+)|eukprot:CAMPEP_0206429802 /NCGR_PEP_ID=MMETSP0324_2-20121206/6445_1 /ASSEMBLY_ACC=CAM_ASM_000836 /TAXON_ID=2866 /ORGANISM="Crypthecodinium cohnii, Strain Seligo" /LENGTH=386 /DNA_ID=CAMNT_0053895527 /DNA_START=28 /DNA_END=1188 /DNA_ORIENTATION=+